MIQIELNGKSRIISLEEFLDRDIQDILADDIGSDMDQLMDFKHDNSSALPEDPIEDI